jgi:hypothetical protein
MPPPPPLQAQMDGSITKPLQCTHNMRGQECGVCVSKPSLCVVLPTIPQVTRASNPGTTTPDADWKTVSTKVLTRLRSVHSFTKETGVTGVRLVVPDGTCIDELELWLDGVVA